MPTNTPPPGWPVGEPYAPYTPSGPSTPGTDYDGNVTKNWYPNGKYQWDDPYLNGDALTRKLKYPHYQSYGDPDPEWRPSFFGETPPWNRNPNDTSGSANTQKGDWFGNTMRDKPKMSPEQRAWEKAEYAREDAERARAKQASRERTQQPSSSSGYPAQQGVSDMQTAPWNTNDSYSYGGGGQYGGPPMPNYGSGTSGGKPYQGPQQGYSGLRYENMPSNGQPYNGPRGNDIDPHMDATPGRALPGYGNGNRRTRPADWMQGGGGGMGVYDSDQGFNRPGRALPGYGDGYQYGGPQSYGGRRDSDPYGLEMQGGGGAPRHDRMGFQDPYQQQMAFQMQGMGGGNPYQEQMKQQMQGMGGGQARGQDFGRIAQGFGQGGGAPMDFAQGFGGADMLRNMMGNRGGMGGGGNPFQNMMGGMAGMGRGNPFMSMMGGMGGGNPFQNMMGGMGGGGNPFQNMMGGMGGGGNPFMNMMGRYR